MCTPGFHLFSLYTGELKFAQTQVLLGTSRGTHLGTLWELDGNMLGIRKKKQKIPVLHPPPPHLSKRKKLDHS